MMTHQTKKFYSSTEATEQLLFMFDEEEEDELTPGKNFYLICLHFSGDINFPFRIFHLIIIIFICMPILHQLPKNSD